MIEELEVFLKTCDDSSQCWAIRYMITGSMAANYYTVPRMAKDIAFVVELSGRDVDRMVALYLLSLLDRSYLLRWSQALRLESLYREVME